MFKLAKRRTLHIWIAMLAVLFSALAPTVSRALTPASPYGYAEICSVDAARKSPSPASKVMEHCAYCVTHGGSFALPPQSMASFAVIGGHDYYPPLFYSAPRPLHSWSAAKPRGPPARS
ncbi:hypothetical protein RugamoR64_25490 [Duganella rhizosphaerae]|uniref:DUF2946 domain-containing protein n=1 Tax=Duganella rhizosphaerae TaxID=2885763 RepID=UPI0030E88C83